MARAVSRALPRIPFLNVGLFLATVASTLYAGGWWAPHTLPALAAGSGAAQVARDVGAIVLAGLPFATSLIGILLCHEMGHYLLARAWRVDSTLPFFIPLPVGYVGTLGAVIRIRSLMPSRRAVLDIGVAGPIAGFAVALPLLAWGLAHSEVQPVGDLLLATGNTSSPFAMIRAWLAGEPLRWSGAQVFGDSVVTWAMQRLAVGRLEPGTDLLLHPVAFAAWIGLLVTTLNLLPIGQLDGGHVVYALLGRRRARIFSTVASYPLLAFGFFCSWTWLVWWLVTKFVVRYDHPPAIDEAPLDRKRKVIAVLGLVLFAITFVPVPVAPAG